MAQSPKCKDAKYAFYQVPSSDEFMLVGSIAYGFMFIPAEGIVGYRLGDFVSIACKEAKGYGECIS